MTTYKNYLEKENYTKSTIKSYENGAEIFIKWCTKNHTSPDLIDYKTILKLLFQQFYLTLIQLLLDI